MERKFFIYIFSVLGINFIVMRILILILEKKKESIWIRIQVINFYSDLLIFEQKEFSKLYFFFYLLMFMLGLDENTT